MAKTRYVYVHVLVQVERIQGLKGVLWGQSIASFNSSPHGSCEALIYCTILVSILYLASTHHDMLAYWDVELSFPSVFAPQSDRRGE